MIAETDSSIDFGTDAKENVFLENSTIKTNYQG